MASDEDEHLWEDDGMETELLRHELETWLLERQTILDVAEDLWKNVVEAYRGESSTTIPLIFLSIAALGQHLNTALKYMSDERAIQDEDRSTPWFVPNTLCQPILCRMHDWCPNKLKGIMRIGSFHLGVLWYLANLQPPTVHDDHSTCTLEQCKSLHVDVSKYRMRHIYADCHCNSIGPSMMELVAIVEKGSIALFTIDPSELEAEICLREETGAEQYVAISHVWADGQGNLDANALPTCVLKQLQEDVDALGLLALPAAHTPIWMDTICLPRRPVALRREAVVRLTDIFTRATGVLVLDSYLKTLDCSNMLPVEVLARCSLSSWTSRLWTFSEGRLAQRIWFQFRDRAMDLNGHIGRYIEELPQSPIPLDPMFETTIFMSELYSGSTLLGRDHDDEQPLLDLGSLKAALSTRQTSWPSDEALCLGAVLRLNLSEIVHAEDAEKMAAFWRQVDAVPISIVFSEVLPKLDQAGCRWAPATMLSGSNSELELLLLDVGLHATPRKQGLEFTLDATVPVAIILSTFGLSSRRHTHQEASSKRCFMEIGRQLVAPALPGEEFVIRDYLGRWHYCSPYRLWHQSPIDLDYEHHMPMILVQLADCIAENMRDQDDQLEGVIAEGLFATYVPSCDEPQMIRPITHIHIFPVQDHKWQSLDKFVKIGAIFAKQHAADGFDLHGEEELILSGIISWLREHHTDDTLIALANILDSVRIDAEFLAKMITCARYVRYFALVGNWYKMQIVDPFEETRWCVF